MADFTEFESANISQKLTGMVVKFVHPVEGSEDLLKDGDKIFLLKQDNKAPIKVRGYGFPVLRRREIVKIRGFFEVDEHDNDIFAAYSVEVRRDEPVYRNGTREYLRQIEGIGLALSQKLIEACGEDIIEKMQEDPNSCKEAEYILRPEVYTRLKNKIARSTPEKKDALKFMYENGLSSLYADRIWKKYREDTVKTLKENPYALIDDVLHFDFVRAEDLAKKMEKHGFNLNSPHRIKAAITYALSLAADEGHSFLKRGELVAFVQTITPEPPKPKIILALDEMLKKGVLVEDVIDGEEVIYTKIEYTAEADGAELLKELISTGKSLSIAPAKLNKIAKKHGLDDSQKEAVVCAIKNPVSIITGGPGTGKTTTMKAVIEALNEAGIDDIAFCSLTGKAARRITETTGREAFTIHRLLEWNYNSATFRRNDKDQLNAKAVIVDEASMVNAFIFYSLLLAIKPGTRLLMIGDDNQLPAIGPGNVLHDCIESGIIPTTRLTTIHRRSEDDMISVNAAHILAGEPMESAENFKIYDVKSSKEIIQAVIAASANKDITKTQVLTPIKKREVGTKELNERLQVILNANERTELKHNGFLYKPGDKVMQMKNDYMLEVMNGEWGIIKSITGIPSSGKVGPETIVTVEMDDTFGKAREVEYDAYSLFNLRPAYACTIHKTQGSEYDTVVIAIPSQCSLLNKNLIYTAITRAKKEVIIIGRLSVINEAIKNNVVETRNCAFAKRLKGEL